MNPRNGCEKSFNLFFIEQKLSFIILLARGGHRGRASVDQSCKRKQQFTSSHECRVYFYPATLDFPERKSYNKRNEQKKKGTSFLPLFIILNFFRPISMTPAFLIYACRLFLLLVKRGVGEKFFLTQNISLSPKLSITCKNFFEQHVRALASGQIWRIARLIPAAFFFLSLGPSWEETVI